MVKQNEIKVLGCIGMVESYMHANAVGGLVTTDFVKQNMNVIKQQVQGKPLLEVPAMSRD